MISVDDNTYNKAPILIWSIATVMEWIKTEFNLISNKDLSTNLLGSFGSLRHWQDNMNEEEVNSKLSYPFLACVIGDMSLDTEKAGLNKRFSSNRGYTVNKDIDSGTASHLILRPIKLGIGVQIATDSIDDIYDFAHLTLMNAPSKTFLLKIDKFPINIKTSIEPSLQIPEINYDGPGTMFDYRTVFTIDTYLGYIDKINLIKNISMSVVEGNSESNPMNQTYFSNDPITLLNRYKKYTDNYNLSIGKFGTGEG